MEFLSRPSATLAQSDQHAAASASASDAESDTSASPDLPPQYYPSPIQERAPQSVARFTHANSNMVGPDAMAYDMNSGSMSPRKSSTPGKTVTFELLVNEALQSLARLPLRVCIFPHDTTDSIVTTVKNFYGLFSPVGISFEDDQGNTLIAGYENFTDEMTVFVRVVEKMSPIFHNLPVSGSSYYHDGYAMPAPPLQQYMHHNSRPASGTSLVRSPSPNGGRGRRSTSAGTNSATNNKGRSRSAKNRALGPQSNCDAHSDTMGGYSSGDGAPGSASGRSKEHLGNTEISVENIVEGGRRKRPKFESSELPLFAPPQMPAAASNSSVSPARRVEHQRNSLPFVHPGNNPFNNKQPLQSPQSYSNGYAHPGMYATPGDESRRTRGSFGNANGAMAPGLGMTPTPDPTVASSMSEEDKDVAMQLMRLGGGMSNISHGRTSASTLDDTFSGIADAASSTGATSDAESESEAEAPPARRQKLDTLGNHKRMFLTTESPFVAPQESVEVSGDEAECNGGAPKGAMSAPRIKSPKPKSGPSSNSGAKPRTQLPARSKSSKPAKSKVKKTSTSAGPMSPASLPTSRKQSVSSNAAFPSAAGEEEQPDLSSKPRCQRCRKSKKGCDRQRPCGRCRDAGLPAEMCISEDEGNGRKGRYGRHMGVPLVKEEMPAIPALLPPAPIAAAADTSVSIGGMVDKNKKRKR